MGTIKEEAQEYTAPQTLNITDLKEVRTDLPMEDREGTDKDGKVFNYKVIIVEEKEYRVPGPVIGSLKAILEKKPDLEKFSVSKTGTGIESRYTVIPL